jgi:hypothetical protein
MYSVDLDNGGKATGFDEVEVGSQVSVEQKGKYTNYKLADGSKPTSVSTSSNGHHDASAAFRGGDDKSAEIKWMASQKVAALLMAGAGTDKVDEMMRVARFIYNEPADVVAEAKRIFNATEAEPVKEAF